MPTDGQRVMARGAEIRLSDGVPRRLVFDLDALEALEEDWDGLGQFADALSRSLQSFRGPRVRVVRSALRSALRASVEAGQVMPWGELAPLITYPLIKDQEVIGAIAEAWLEAVVDPEQKPDPKADRPPDSTGPGSTTSPPSDTAVLTASSAA